MPDRIKLHDCEFSICQGDIFKAEAAGGFGEKYSVLVTGYNALPEIDLEAETRGDGRLAALAALSARQPATVFCGVKTRLADFKHISVAVCHKGKLIDIVNRTSNPFGDEYCLSDKIKVFLTGRADIGVLVDSDVLIESNWEKTAPVCDVILSIVAGSDPLLLDEATRIAAKYDVSALFVNDDDIRWKDGAYA
ncbi:MAG: hypothetical protein LBP26_07070 [Clostridiales bacterium]|jgi:hypothetical protein|nr:hypothetical protein [Clostridiales bacterium]